MKGQVPELGENIRKSHTNKGLVFGAGAIVQQ